MIRVLLVDDQAIIRGGLRTVLADEDDMEVVGEATDGQVAVTMAVATTPDVVLMDIRMPRMDGLAATVEIIDRVPTARVLALTTFDDEELVFGMLRAGAAGFLLKDMSPEDLVVAIRQVADGEAALSPSAARRLVEHLMSTPAPMQAQEAEARTFEKLTEREREVLRRVARARTNAEIANDLGVSDTTVKTHVSRILGKLGLRDRAHLIVAAYELGLVQPRHPG